MRPHQGLHGSMENYVGNCSTRGGLEGVLGRHELADILTVVAGADDDSLGDILVLRNTCQLSSLR